MVRIVQQRNYNDDKEQWLLDLATQLQQQKESKSQLLKSQKAENYVEYSMKLNKHLLKNIALSAEGDSHPQILKVTDKNGRKISISNIYQNASSNKIVKQPPTTTTTTTTTASSSISTKFNSSNSSNIFGDSLSQASLDKERKQIQNEYKDDLKRQIDDKKQRLDLSKRRLDDEDNLNNFLPLNTASKSGLNSGIVRRNSIDPNAGSNIFFSSNESPRQTALKFENNPNRLQNAVIENHQISNPPLTIMESTIVRRNSMDPNLTNSQESYDTEKRVNLEIYKQELKTQIEDKRKREVARKVNEDNENSFYQQKDSTDARQQFVNSSNIVKRNSLDPNFTNSQESYDSEKKVNLEIYKQELKNQIEDKRQREEAFKRNESMDNFSSKIGFNPTQNVQSSFSESIIRRNSLDPNSTKSSETYALEKKSKEDVYKQDLKNQIEEKRQREIERKRAENDEDMRLAMGGQTKRIPEKELSKDNYSCQSMKQLSGDINRQPIKTPIPQQHSHHSSIKTPKPPNFTNPANRWVSKIPRPQLNHQQIFNPIQQVPTTTLRQSQISSIFKPKINEFRHRASTFQHQHIDSNNESKLSQHQFGHNHRIDSNNESKLSQHQLGHHHRIDSKNESKLSQHQFGHHRRIVSNKSINQHQRIASNNHEVIARANSRMGENRSLSRVGKDQQTKSFPRGPLAGFVEQEKKEEQKKKVIKKLPPIKTEGLAEDMSEFTRCLLDFRSLLLEELVE